MVTSLTSVSQGITVIAPCKQHRAYGSFDRAMWQCSFFNVLEQTADSHVSCILDSLIQRLRDRVLRRGKYVIL